MTNPLNAQKVGLAVGGMCALLHLVWSLLILLGLAQALIDFVLRIHMVSATHTVLPFSASSAVVLIILTGVIGYIVGFVFATIWNKIEK